MRPSDEAEALPLLLPSTTEVVEPAAFEHEATGATPRHLALSPPLRQPLLQPFLPHTCTPARLQGLTDTPGSGSAERARQFTAFAHFATRGTRRAFSRWAAWCDLRVAFIARAAAGAHFLREVRGLRCLHRHAYRNARAGRIVRERAATAPVPLQSGRPALPLRRAMRAWCRWAHRARLLLHGWRAVARSRRLRKAWRVLGSPKLHGRHRLATFRTGRAMDVWRAHACEAASNKRIWRDAHRGLRARRLSTATRAWSIATFHALRREASCDAVTLRTQRTAIWRGLGAMRVAAARGAKLVDAGSHARRTTLGHAVASWLRQAAERSSDAARAEAAHRLARRRVLHEWTKRVAEALTRHARVEQASLHAARREVARWRRQHAARQQESERLDSCEERAAAACILHKLRCAWGPWLRHSARQLAYTHRRRLVRAWSTLNRSLSALDGASSLAHQHARAATRCRKTRSIHHWACKAREVSLLRDDNAKLCRLADLFRCKRVLRRVNAIRHQHCDVRRSFRRWASAAADRSVTQELLRRARAHHIREAVVVWHCACLANHLGHTIGAQRDAALSRIADEELRRRDGAKVRRSWHRWVTGARYGAGWMWRRRRQVGRALRMWATRWWLRSCLPRALARRGALRVFFARWVVFDLRGHRKQAAMLTVAVAWHSFAARRRAVRTLARHRMYRHAQKRITLEQRELDRVAILARTIERWRMPQLLNVDLYNRAMEFRWEKIKSQWRQYAGYRRLLKRILGAANRRVLRLMMRNWRHFVSLEQRYRRLLQGLHKPFRPLMGRPAWKPPASPFQQLHGVVTPTTKRISL